MADPPTPLRGRQALSLCLRGPGETCKGMLLIWRIVAPALLPRPPPGSPARGLWIPGHLLILLDPRPRWGSSGKLTRGQAHCSPEACSCAPRTGPLPWLSGLPPKLLRRAKGGHPPDQGNSAWADLGEGFPRETMRTPKLSSESAQRGHAGPGKRDAAQRGAAAIPPGGEQGQGWQQGVAPGGGSLDSSGDRGNELQLAPARR